MIALLLLLVPLVTGFATFFLKNDRIVRAWALLAAMATLAVALIGSYACNNDAGCLAFSAPWMSLLNSSFTIKLDGMGQLVCLLNAIAYTLVFLATWKTSYSKAHNFYALMLLAQAGMMGVFLAQDALLFYFAWELALIPMYFLCSQWGGEKRIAVTFKFFIYTFVGSLLMLIGILYVYAHTPMKDFSIQQFYNAKLEMGEQQIVFWLMFLAFAIKMPIFPFHTWQPDTYEQSPAATTMILSGVMVKMGVFALLRWLLPVVPLASFQWGDVVTSMAVIGMIYASLIAIRQDDLKRLVAYSSIAHIGLMAAAIFSENNSSVQGAMVQMFNHGINIIGLWIVVEIIERQFGTRKISDLGGLAQKAPAMAILLVIVALANIALPLTNAFPGEFLMFNGIFSSGVTQYGKIFTVLAGLSIILSAVYTLNMIRKVFYGNTNELTGNTVDINLNEKIVLVLIAGMIFWFGVCPQSLLNLAKESSDLILEKANVLPLLKK